MGGLVVEAQESLGSARPEEEQDADAAQPVVELAECLASWQAQRKQAWPQSAAGLPLAVVSQDWSLMFGSTVALLVLEVP